MQTTFFRVGVDAYGIVEAPTELGSLPGTMKGDVCDRSAALINEPHARNGCGERKRSEAPTEPGSLGTMTKGALCRGSLLVRGCPFYRAGDRRQQNSRLSRGLNYPFVPQPTRDVIYRKLWDSR